MARVQQRNGELIVQRQDSPLGELARPATNKVTVALLLATCGLALFAYVDEGVVVRTLARVGHKPRELAALEKVEEESRKHEFDIKSSDRHYVSRGERLRLAMGTDGDLRVHPQKYVPLEYGDNGFEFEGAAKRRRTQDSSTSGALTESNTQPLKIHVLTDALFEETALPYSTCFKAGAWFKWGFPEKNGFASPPVCSPKCDKNGCTLSASESVYATYAQSSQDPCAGTSLTGNNVYSPSNPTGRFCNRNYDPSSQHCWGVCLDRDVLQTTDEPGCKKKTGKNTFGSNEVILQGDECNMRTWMINRINQYAPEAEALFRSRKRTQNLILSKDAGKYRATYAAYNANTKSACAKDAQMVYFLPIPDSFCTVGIEADVILVPIMSQYINGVAGWGGSAGDDQYGKPLVLVFSWSAPITAGGTRSGNSIRYDGREHDLHGRGTIIHEIIHGLGFGLSQFKNHIGQNGQSSPIVHQSTYTDVNGKVDSAVWSVTSKRTLDVAKDYFNCTSLTELPLMAENQLGPSQRGSHWETRIMNDEIMSYGEGAAVSPFTVALMEDLGFYMGNYTTSECMYWGRNQGCPFVSSRCAVRRDDLSVKFRPAGAGGKNGEQCQRGYKYAGAQKNDILVSACGTDSTSGTANTNGPMCNRVWPGTKAGTAVNGVAQVYCDDTATKSLGITSCSCNAECYSGHGSAPDSGCAAPTGVLLAAGSRKGATSDATAFLKQLYLPVGCFLIMLIFISCVIRCIKKSDYGHLVALAYVVNIIFVLVGLTLFVVCIYTYVHFSKFEGLFERKHIMWAMLLSLGILAFSTFGVAAVCCATRCSSSRCMVHKWMVGFFDLMLFGLICCQTFGAFMIFAWVWDSYSISGGTYTSGLDQDDRKISTGIDAIDNFLDSSLTSIDGYACNSYVKCCWAANETETRTSCTAVSSQNGDPLAQTLNDPSQDGFCTAVTGSKIPFKPPAPLCNALHEVGVIDLTKCHAEFCNSGKNGFEAFIGDLFEWIRSHLIPLGAAVGTLGLLEASQLVVGIGLWCTSKEKLHEGGKEFAESVFRKRNAERRKNASGKARPEKHEMRRAAPRSAGGHGGTQRSGGGQQREPSQQRNKQQRQAATAQQAGFGGGRQDRVIVDIDDRPAPRRAARENTPPRRKHTTAVVDL